MICSRNKKIPNLVIITPCSRPDNIRACYNSIKFDMICTWILVYDTRRQIFKKRFRNTHPKILELEYAGEGIVGNQQRNYALDWLQMHTYKGLVYFLDDDTIIHPNFWSILPTCTKKNHLYSFDQYRNHTRFIGSTIQVTHIDTAQCILDMNLIQTTRFIPNKYEADGLFFCEIAQKKLLKHVYIPVIASYYNFLRDDILNKSIDHENTWLKKQRVYL